MVILQLLKFNITVYITSNIDRLTDTLIKVKNYQIYTFLCLKDLSKTFYNYLQIFNKDQNFSCWLSMFEIFRVKPTKVYILFCLFFYIEEDEGSIFGCQRLFSGSSVFSKRQISESGLFWIICMAVSLNLVRAFEIVYEL